MTSRALAMLGSLFAITGCAGPNMHGRLAVRGKLGDFELTPTQCKMSGRDLDLSDDQGRTIRLTPGDDTVRIANRSAPGGPAEIALTMTTCRTLAMFTHPDPGQPNSLGRHQNNGVTGGVRVDCTTDDGTQVRGVVLFGGLRVKQGFYGTCE